MAEDTDKQRPTILVVDDEPFIRFTASDYITSAGWQSLEAENAEEAKAVIEAHPETKVLFTDINMPGPIDGLQLAEQIRTWVW